MCEVEKEGNEKRARQSTPCFFFFFFGFEHPTQGDGNTFFMSVRLAGFLPFFFSYSTRERDVRIEGNRAAHTGRRLTAHTNKPASEPASPGTTSCRIVTTERKRSTTETCLPYHSASLSLVGLLDAQNEKKNKVTYSREQSNNAAHKNSFKKINIRNCIFVYR